MRKSIFEIVKENNSISKETERIVSLYTEWQIGENYLRSYSLEEYVDEYCFFKWKGRGHCIDINDYKNAINYEEVVAKAKNDDLDCFLILAEYVFNMLQLAYKDIYNRSYNDYLYNTVFQLWKLLEDSLKEYNFKFYYDEKEEGYIAIEDSAELREAVEAVDEDTALLLIKYNARDLKGNITEKKRILQALSNDFEKNRKALQRFDNELASNIAFIFNNFDIRHNNLTKGMKEYKEYVAQLSNDILEEIYDDLYQMIICSVIELKNEELKEKYSKIKQIFSDKRRC